MPPTGALALGAATRGEEDNILDMRLLTAAVLVLALCDTARAQGAPAAPAASAGDAAAEKSAMERAQREADGPRRRILEAARVRGIVRAEPPPTGAVAVPVVAPPAAAPVAERPVNLGALPAVVDPVPLPASAAVGAPLMAPIEARAPAAPLLAPLPQARAVVLDPPRLLSRVDPDLPGRLQRRQQRRLELTADLVIATDGRVVSVAFRGDPDDELEAAARAALLQWRFDAQPIERPHTVQLVFGAG